MHKWIELDLELQSEVKNASKSRQISFLSKWLDFDFKASIDFLP